MVATLRERRVTPALERCDRFDSMLDQLEGEGVLPLLRKSVSRLRLSPS